MRLKTKLGLGAALLGISTLLTAAILVVGMDRVTQRLDAALAAERRIDRYSALSTQVSTFIVVAAESIQTGLPREQRVERLESITENILRTFRQLRLDLQDAVEEARALGFDEQSRRATQSIGIARMEALLIAARDGFLSESQDRERLQGFLDIFATGFDPLLNEVVVNEVRARDTVLASIDDLRRNLIYAALTIAAVTIVAFALFYFVLVRPQFRRLDLLRDAARRIEKQDFAIRLPVDRQDEIGGLFLETNRMAAALSAREEDVDREWSRLNDTIAQRTEELRTANARLAKTDEDRRRFFADISHELRTPLTVIRMEAELGKAGAPEPAAAFATIETRAERLNRRIDDLLRIARSESGQLALDSASFDLALAARDAIAECKAEATSAGVSISDDISGPSEALGDANWARQVLVGIVRNGIRHARGGQSISLRSEETVTESKIHVIDNGAGIAPGDRDALFERFAQGDPETRAQGFGIGLALAKWVIEAQGGTIDIVSPVPRTLAIGDAPGTMVSVALPKSAD